MLHVGHKRKSVQKEGGVKEPISIMLSHIYVEMNKMCLKSISVVISFPKIIFEIEHYECKSWMMLADEGMHAEVWDKTSKFFHLFLGVWHKMKIISFFIQHVTFGMVPSAMQCICIILPCYPNLVAVKMNCLKYLSFLPLTHNANRR